MMTSESLGFSIEIVGAEAQKPSYRMIATSRKKIGGNGERRENYAAKYQLGKKINNRK